MFQGINDISVMRKDNEIAGLKSNVAHLRSELAHAQKTIFAIKDTETLLKEQLSQEKQRAHTLEKLATTASATPASQSESGEDLPVIDFFRQQPEVVSLELFNVT